MQQLVLIRATTPQHPCHHAGLVVIYWPQRELQLTLPPAADLAGNKEPAVCQRGPSLPPLEGEDGWEGATVLEQRNLALRSAPRWEGPNCWHRGCVGGWRWEEFGSLLAPWVWAGKTSVILSSMLSHQRTNGLWDFFFLFFFFLTSQKQGMANSVRVWCITAPWRLF